MRLPFSSRKGQETNDSSSRRSSVCDDPHNNDDDTSSQRSTRNSNSTPLDTPATSYSSYNSVNDHEGKRTGMYKLSVVDTSGTFLPPSPPDTARTNGNKAWSLHRKSQNKSRERVTSTEGPFIISRESFEGYRRSFDIGATSPAIASSPTFASSPRLSLDSSLSARTPSISSRTGSRLRVSSIPKVEEGGAVEAPFEDVKLEEDDRSSRKTILSRFGFGQRANVGRKKEGGEELQSFKTEN